MQQVAACHISEPNSQPMNEYAVSTRQAERFYYVNHWFNCMQFSLSVRVPALLPLFMCMSPYEYLIKNQSSCTLAEEEQL